MSNKYRYTFAEKDKREKYEYSDLKGAWNEYRDICLKRGETPLSFKVLWNIMKRTSIHCSGEEPEVSHTFERV